MPLWKRFVITFSVVPLRSTVKLAGFMVLAWMYDLEFPYLQELKHKSDYVGAVSSCDMDGCETSRKQGLSFLSLVSIRQIDSTCGSLFKTCLLVTAMI